MTLPASARSTTDAANPDLAATDTAATETTYQPGPPWVDADTPVRGLPRAIAVALAAAVLVGAEVSIGTGAYLPYLSPLLGFLACVGVPLFLIYQLLGRRPWFLGGERLAVAVAGTLLVLIVVALVDNTVLPVLGVARPLDTWPVLITGDVVGAVLALLAYPAMPARIPVAGLLPRGWRAGCAAGWPS